MTQAEDDILGGVCVRCGYSHHPEDRRAALARMLPSTFDGLREAWPCRYPTTPAGTKRLQRDLEAIGAIFGGSVFWARLWHLPAVEDLARPRAKVPGVQHQRAADAKAMLDQFAEAAAAEAAANAKAAQAKSLQRALLVQLQAAGVARRFAARRWVLAHGGNPRDEAQIRRAKQLLLMRNRSSR